MTREIFFEWLTNQGCTHEPLRSNTTGNVVLINSPHIDRQAFLDTPIDDSPMKCYTVCKICKILLLEVPEECKHMEGFTDYVKKKHYPNYWSPHMLVLFFLTVRRLVRLSPLASPFFFFKPLSPATPVKVWSVVSLRYLSTVFSI